MPDTQDSERVELIRMLHKGKMLSHRLLERLVDGTHGIDDSGPLLEYLTKFPPYLGIARRNINLEHYQKLDNPMRPYPSRDDVRKYLSGPLKFGYVNEFNDMFGFDWDLFCLFCIFAGRVGTGKSVLIKYLLSQIPGNGCKFNVIIPDLKAEYRDLLTINPRLKVLTANRIRINPLEVPSWMTPQDHVVFFSKVFRSENWLGITSENILSDAVEYLYRKRGVFDGNTTNYPTLRDLYYYITHRLQNQKSFQFRDILLRLQGRLKSYLISTTFDCLKGIPHDVWRNENVVLEMDTGFTDHVYTFIVSYIAGLRYTYNKVKGLIGSVLRTLFMVDEGRILFRVRDAEVYGESYITELITKSREFGIGFVVASPETASFNQTIKAISYLKICFPLTDGEEKATIERSFGLDEEQAAYLFKLPRCGQAIVRYGGYEKPFLLAVPHFRIKKHLSDEEVVQSMAGFYKQLDESIRKKEAEGKIGQIETVPPNAASLLFNLGKKPFTRMSDMTKFSGFKSPTEVSNTLEWLLQHGFVEMLLFRVSKRGRKSTFAALTNKSHSYLNIKGAPGKGDFEHKLYQFIIAESCDKKGEGAKIEGRMKSDPKVIDVLARLKDGRYIAYEVTLHLENMIYNIQQDLAAGVSEVVVVTRNSKDLDKAIEKVGREPSLRQSLDQLTFRTIDEFFN